MKKKYFFTVVFIVLSMIMFGCNNKNQSITEHNTKMFIDKLNIKEAPAKGASERLENIGCGRITSFTDIDKNDRAYSMKIMDDKGNIYQITMNYDGYLGVVKDKNGKYLVEPID